MGCMDMVSKFIQPNAATLAVVRPALQKRPESSSTEAEAIGG